MIIATYCSGPDLDGVIASLDAQSMPASDFEVILVDDGSPDDTFERLEAFSRERPNIRVIQIEHSGWPGRPRNVAMRATTAEYVFFVDHDDYVFPEALERMYVFAVANRLDVVHGKEVVKGWSTPGWTTWRQQIPRGFDRSTFDCITPHKMYRRQFLVDNGIEFPEGRVRLEDFVLNGHVWSKTEAIGVLADYPCYQWRLHGGNAHKAPYDEAVYWRIFAESLQPILENVPAGTKRDLLLRRWYRSRILERVGPTDDFLRRSPDVARALVETLQNQMEPFPPEVDAALSPPDRTRAALLRRGDVDALRMLASEDTGARLATSECVIGVHGSGFNFRARGFLADAAGEPLAFADGERLVRQLPEPLAERLSPQDRSYQDVLDTGEVELVVRDRATSADWVLPGTGTWSAGPGEEPGTSSLTWDVDATLHPQTAAAGLPLASSLHEIFVRSIGLGLASANRLTQEEGLPLALMTGGRVVETALLQSRFLAVQATQDSEDTLSRHLPAPQDVQVTARQRRHVRIRLPLPGLHIEDGPTSPQIRVVLAGTRSVGKVTQHAMGVVVEAVVPRPPAGVHRLRIRAGSPPAVDVGWVLLDAWPHLGPPRVVGPQGGRRLKRAWRAADDRSRTSPRRGRATRAWDLFTRPRERI